ncbi:hypothetical protein H0O00_01470 [Candidatus Micrarchaeota archaeon]|nr:hypothetical protein [Candidatus Micrarchaeota archaeon]
MEEALRRADEAGLVIASNKRMSKALVGSDEWQSIREAFACWNGTMTAYDEPGKKLGKTIEYVDSETSIRYVFPVPEEHVGKKNVVLVAEHPDFTLETDGNTRIVQAKEVGVVSEFPVASENWYLGDAKYDIPTGKKVDSSNDAARYLWRIEKRVGLVARGIYGGYVDRRYVYLDYAPSFAFGVAVEAPDANVASDIAPLVRSVEHEGGRPLQKLQVEAADTGVVITGVTLDELRTLLGNANADLQDVLQTVRQEKLAAVRQLLQALEIKE